MKLFLCDPFVIAFIGIIIVLLEYPRFSSCRGRGRDDDDEGETCPPHKKLIGTKIVNATDSPLSRIVVSCKVGSSSVFDIKYANNSLCVCANVKKNVDLLHCEKQLSNMTIHITVSVDEVPRNKDKSCSVHLFYLTKKQKHRNGREVKISVWRKNVAYSTVIASRFPVKTTAELLSTSTPITNVLSVYSSSISTKRLSSFSSMTPILSFATQSSLITSSLVNLPVLSVTTVVQPSPTTDLVTSSSVWSYVDPKEQQLMKDLDFINKVNTSTVEINDTKIIEDILKAASNVMRSNRTNEDEQKMFYEALVYHATLNCSHSCLTIENNSYKLVSTISTIIICPRDPGIKAVQVLQDLGKTISRQLNLGNKSQITFQKYTENLVFGVAAIDTRISSGFSFPSVDKKTKSEVGDEKIEIPQSVFTTSSRKAFFVGIIFNGVREMRNRTGNQGFVLGSKVINAEVSPPPPATLQKPVILTFEKRLDMPSYQEDCSFWIENNSSGEHGKWSTENCTVFSQNKTHIKCACYHFTNFAVLFKTSNDQNISEEDAFNLLIITYVGLGLSILGCFLTFVIYVSLRNLKSDRSAIHTNLVLALGIADVIFLVSVVIEPVQDTCLALTMLAFFFYLAVFFWMFVEGIYIYLMIIKVFRGNTRRRRRLAYLVGWGCPVVIALVTWAILRDDVVSKYHCWLSVDSGAIWAFVAPGLLIILFNIIILIAVMRTTWATFVDDKEYGGLRSAVKTFGAVIPILGITWVFGVMAFNEASVVFQYIFAITNSIQGIIIFILYCLVSDEVRNEILRQVSVWQTRRDVSSSSGARRPYVTTSDKTTTFSRTTQSTKATSELSMNSLSKTNDPALKISKTYSFEQTGVKDSENDDCEFAATSSKSENCD